MLLSFGNMVPQTALLNDPRLSAFLTHGGLGSTTELTFLGKPALMVPIFTDQERNANMLARHGGVRVFQKNDLKNVKAAVYDILFNKKYLEHSQKLAEILNNQPTHPKDQVVKYVEFVRKFGPFPKMNSGRNIGFIQKNLIDVFFVLYAPYFGYFVFLSLVFWLVKAEVVYRKVKEL
ncbi:hypothetical protein L5515_006632 [Caenorhabditis briggsae]|uniref:glucuronosyltransferase n=1 Tax=Caenorhabditis briggsae TaxID=6238 RepID=A0AAE9F319_CAEBR|nr:hypothetical protein L5515_006632 [Caenorhabditis briggsae]